MALTNGEPSRQDSGAWRLGITDTNLAEIPPFSGSIGLRYDRVTRRAADQSPALGLLGFAFGAALISQTYQYFPRRVVIVAFDQYVLLAIVVVICVAGGLLGVWKAMRVDPTVALGGGA